MTAVKDSHSRYKTNLDAVFSEVQYQFPESKLGYFGIVGSETYKHSKYVDTSNPFFQKTNVLGGLVEWIGVKRSIRWYLSLGMNWFYTSSTNLKKSHNLYIPTPRVNIDWRVSKNTRLSFEYSYSGGIPSIAQLSETNQWIDTRLVYHGNSTLKPYKTHSAGLRFVWNNKYVNLAVRNSFTSSPDMICDMYTTSDRYMLQTFVNL